MKVLLIGIDYFSNRGSGDKNFWHQLMPLLSAEMGSVFVVSFNYRRIQQEFQNQNITIFNVSPAHLGIDWRLDNANVQNKDKCHSHFSRHPRSLVERSASILKIVPLLRKLITEHHIEAIHLMDNFGPIMGWLKYLFPSTLISVSAVGYFAQGALHDTYLSFSFRRLDTVIPYSEAYKEKLIEIGMPVSRLKTIRWGIKTPPIPIGPGDKEKAKRNLGISPETTLVLWTGFIQQIREQDMLIAIQIAQHVLEQTGKAHFFFALKPECYKEEYASYSQVGIHILSTDQATFSKILKASNILLSPLVNTASIITPPLTWLESMAHGVPVITTEIPGVDAVVKNEWNGHVVSSIDQLASVLISCVNTREYHQLGRNARKHVQKYYNVNQIAKEYASFWRKNV